MSVYLPASLSCWQGTSFCVSFSPFSLHGSHLISLLDPTLYILNTIYMPKDLKLVASVQVSLISVSLTAAVFSLFPSGHLTDMSHTPLKLTQPLLLSLCPPLYTLSDSQVFSTKIHITKSINYISEIHFEYSKYVSWIWQFHAYDLMFKLLLWHHLN